MKPAVYTSSVHHGFILTPLLFMYITYTIEIGIFLRGFPSTIDTTLFVPNFYNLYVKMVLF